MKVHIVMNVRIDYLVIKLYKGIISCRYFGLCKFLKVFAMGTLEEVVK